MRVGALEKVEVRIPRRQGDAITVQLRAPEGGILIDPLSPETRWTDEAKGDGNEYASWGWNITPQRRGKVPLRLIISVHTSRRKRNDGERRSPRSGNHGFCPRGLWPHR